MPSQTEQQTGNKIFISHVMEDAAVALHLAHGLEEQGYSTWCYEVDSIPGPSHIEQTLAAIEDSDAVVMLISPDCVRSHEVTTELTRAQDHRKPIIPLLLDITYKELMNRRSEWGQRLGSATCLTVGEDVARIIPRLIQGLEYYEVTPGKAHQARATRLQTIEDELADRGRPMPAQPAPASAPTDDPSSRTDPPPPPAAAAVETPPAEAAGKTFLHPGHARHLGEVVQRVEGILQSEKLLTQVIDDGETRMVQGKQEEQQKWKKVMRTTLGLEHAVSVSLTAKGDDLEMCIGAGKWMDKAVGGAIGAVVFWPAAVTAGYGVYRQKQLFTRIERDIETFLAGKA